MPLLREVVSKALTICLIVCLKRPVMCIEIVREVTTERTGILIALASKGFVACGLPWGDWLEEKKTLYQVYVKAVER